VLHRPKTANLLILLIVHRVHCGSPESFRCRGVENKEIDIDFLHFLSRTIFGQQQGRARTTEGEAHVLCRAFWLVREEMTEADCARRRVRMNSLMRILLIGGNGFIGRFVVAALKQQGHALAVFHRGSAPAPEGVEEILGTGTNSVPALRNCGALLPMW
jgi:hypothetical protein